MTKQNAIHVLVRTYEQFEKNYNRKYGVIHSHTRNWWKAQDRQYHLILKKEQLKGETE